MKNDYRNGIVLIIVLLASAIISGCGSTIPADANIIDVNESLSQKSSEVQSQTGTAELPIEALDLATLMKDYPSAIFVTASGKVISESDDEPYTEEENECYVGPLRMDALYKGASSVVKFETDSYVKGTELSWWKSQKLKSEKVLPIPSVEPDEPIAIDSSKTVSIYFLPFVFLDKDTNQYAVLKDSDGSAKGIWAIIPQQD